MRGLFKTGVVASGLVMACLGAHPAFGRITTPAEAKERGVELPSQQAEAMPQWGPADGNYLMKLGIGKPRFTTLKYFDVLYGSTGYMPNFSLNYYFWNKPVVALGGGLQVGYYSDTGKEVKRPSVENPRASELEKAGGGLSLTLIPYRILFTAHLRPFAAGTMFSFLNFDVWAGYEELYFREIRTPKETTTASTATNTGTSTSSGTSTTTGLRARASRQRMADATTTQSDQMLINRGWNAHSVFGAAINIRINSLDEKSVRSLGSSLGIHSIYVSPYFEIATALGDTLITGGKVDKPSFARQTYGIAFTFEGLM